MDTDAVIGRLYREVQEALESNSRLVALVTGIKSGDIALARVEITEGVITVRPELEVVEATA